MTLEDILLAFGIIAITALLLALLGLTLLARRLRRLNLPSNVGVFETLRAVPLGLVMVLDLLDLSLDIFSAPVAWAILDRFGLQNLRQITVIQALIPGTQLIPTMTLAWFLARYSGWKLPPGRVQTPSRGVKIDGESSPPSRQRRNP